MINHVDSCILIIMRFFLVSFVLSFTWFHTLCFNCNFTQFVFSVSTIVVIFIRFCHFCAHWSYEEKTQNTSTYVVWWKNWKKKKKWRITVCLFFAVVYYCSSLASITGLTFCYVVIASAFASFYVRSARLFNFMKMIDYRDKRTNN